MQFPWSWIFFWNGLFLVVLEQIQSVEGYRASWSPTNKEDSRLMAKRSTCVPYEQINLRDTDGWTKLHKAARDGNPKLVKDLISCGASVNVLSQIGSIPLHEAAFFGNDDALAELLDAESDVNQRKEEVKGWAPIHLAVPGGHYSTVNLLIARGADVNLRTLDDQTALDIAVKHGHESIVELLKEHGARS